MRPIDADALNKKIFPYRSLLDPKTYTINAKAVEYAIQTSPTVDAVAVVRCKDCKFYKANSCFNPQWDMEKSLQIPFVFETDYCSYGERREQ